jgi:type IV pilus assembly protein PilA
MKKLNRKGFTLVELLAVIIILAIVVGISIPAITSVINDSKNNATGVAVDAAEKYVRDQYSLFLIGNAESTFTTRFTNGTTAETELSYETAGDVAVLNAMGFSKADVKKVKVTINADGTACVKISEVVQTGKFYTAKYWPTVTGPATDAKNESKGC